MKNLKMVKKEQEEFLEDENLEEQTEETEDEVVEVVPNNKGKVKKIIKAVGYGVAFVLGVGLTLFLTKKDDDDDESEETESDDYSDLHEDMDKILDALDVDKSTVEVTDF